MRSSLVDSSVIIEALKGNPVAKRVLQSIENDSKFMLPLTKEIEEKAFEFVLNYGLLPNDAIILATAKFYDLTLVTLDSDFIDAAKSEGIEIIVSESFNKTERVVQKG